ncbi:uncharacterized protein SRS1_12516 [Sporisorium reilianum f. sp. reilianum]|uniref:Tyrosine specific protein phosphatases domain-containing protein n=1 Tax=Sporisorium reilianum f. sp. reilianum TaxID=72559 RepID=A0A2N8U9R8_9BASI|nr:uncharacterized protein SRS1_12516 [Sporisorium reilianum f. sp. reilianum]
MSLKPLTPPLRFSTVAFAGTDQPQPYWQLSVQEDSADPRSHPHHRESVYRGAYPKARNLSFLSRLHLRTVLSLTPRPLDNDAALMAWSSSAADPSSPSPSTTVAEKASKLGIQLLHVRCEKPKDESGGLTREGAARALSILLDRRNHPIYVHCLDGVEVTSTLVACMRKVQAWSNPAILAELGRALRDSNSSEWTEVPSHLSSFLTKFGQPDGIRLPPRNHIPSWLWPTPNPLSILADPYAWAGSAHPSHTAASHGQNGAGSSNASSTDASMSRNPSHATNNGSSDGHANAASATSAHPPIQSHLRRDRQLPIHHPTLKLHFEHDPHLPPEPVASSSSAAAAASSSAASAQRPMTPARPPHNSSLAASSHGIASLRTPPHSRPASRAGRAPTSSSHHATSRSASLAPDENVSRSSASASRVPTSSLISPRPASPDRQLPASAVASVAAFLEDQVQDRNSGSDTDLTNIPHESESPTRRSRAELGPEARLDLPQSNKLLSTQAQPPISTQPASTSNTSPIDADTDEIDVSTPRARPTTSSNFNIGIAGTIFHHDDEITDNEGENALSGRTTGATSTTRVVVPLEQRRRRPMLDDADGEQTPTKANAMAQRQALPASGQSSIDVVTQRYPAARDLGSTAASHAKELSLSSMSSTRSSFDEQRDDERSEDMVQSPSTYGPDDDDRTSDSGKKAEGYQDGDENDASDTEQVRADEADAEDGDEEQEEDVEEEEEEDEEEEEEEEDEEEEEEDDGDDDDEDDLALEALDLEGY